MASSNYNRNSGNRRRRNYKSANRDKHPRSIIVETSKFFDGKDNVPMVRILREDEETSHLMGIPIDEFDFDISEGQKFRIICEPL